MLCLVNVTASGIHVRRWVERLVNQSEGRGDNARPALCTKNGMILERSVLTGELFDAIAKVQAACPEVVEFDVSIESSYNIHRSFRRGATTRAREAGVPKDAIEMNNRWRKVENKSGGMPRVPMAELYTEIRQALATCLRFSKAL